MGVQYSEADTRRPAYTYLYINIKENHINKLKVLAPVWRQKEQGRYGYGLEQLLGLLFNLNISV